jgi:hypothetical protein
LHLYIRLLYDDINKREKKMREIGTKR